MYSAVADARAHALDAFLGGLPMSLVVAAEPDAWVVSGTLLRYPEGAGEDGQGGRLRRADTGYALLRIEAGPLRRAD